MRLCSVCNLQVTLVGCGCNVMIYSTPEGNINTFAYITLHYPLLAFVSDWALYCIIRMAVMRKLDGWLMDGATAVYNARKLSTSAVTFLGSTPDM